MKRLLPALLLVALAVVAPALQAQTAAPAPAQVAPPAVAADKGAPAGFVAPAEPKPDESNADRTKSQPGNNAPLWRGVRESGTQPGYSSLPGVEQGVLIQPMVQVPGMRVTTAGELWRQFRNGWIVPYGGALFLLAMAFIALVYWKLGKMGGHSTDVGRKIERFTPYERTIHWTVAISFVVLEVSGLVIAFGKFFLLPIIGGQLFGWLTYALKTLHNFVGPVFAVSLVLFIIAYVRDNWLRVYDLKWLIYGIKGMVTGHEYPSHKFNAGEKSVFWLGVILLGLLVVGSGFVLDKLVPGMDYLRTDMQAANLVHLIAALLMMTLFLVHMYLGTIGLDGAYQAMRTGWVDEAWAKEHHEYWYDDIKAGKIPAQRSGAMPPVAGQQSGQAVEGT